MSRRVAICGSLLRHARAPRTAWPKPAARRSGGKRLATTVWRRQRRHGRLLSGHVCIAIGHRVACTPSRSLTDQPVDVRRARLAHTSGPTRSGRDRLWNGRARGEPGTSLPPIYAAARAAAAASRLQRNPPPSAHMRCMITASLRTTATVARRNPRRLAIAMPHAFSADPRVRRISNVSTRNNASHASRSPVLLILPLRSVSPDAHLCGVSRRWAPASRERPNCAGSSIGFASP